MTPLITLTSVVAPLLRDNIDTDAIIPAAFMRSLDADHGRALFARWRYRDDGTEQPAFVLNDPRYREARILLAGANFGCGSSRENAVWALEGFGIRCVIALGFSDIFRENAYKNGLLPVVVSAEDHGALAGAAHDGELRATVDVAAKQITTSAGPPISFVLDARRQASLLSGADEIAGTLAAQAHVERFRDAHRSRAPWLYSFGPGHHGATKND